jgi:hypothetical protein
MKGGGVVIWGARRCGERYSSFRRGDGRVFGSLFFAKLDGDGGGFSVDGILRCGHVGHVYTVLEAAGQGGKSLTIKKSERSASVPTCRFRVV